MTPLIAGAEFFWPIFRECFSCLGRCFLVLGKIESELLENTRHKIQMEFKGGDPMPPCPGNRRPLHCSLVIP